jgi:hypothetical protein
MAGTTNNQLTGEHKEFIVKRLAAFYTPSVICQQLVAQFGIKCNENDILANDPTTCVVSPELFMLFRSERERVLVDPESAPLADQKARLIALNRHFDRYNSNNQLAEARAVLRQIAEELGVVGGKAGAGKTAVAVPTEVAQVQKVTRTIIDPAKIEAVE